MDTMPNIDRRMDIAASDKGQRCLMRRALLSSLLVQIMVSRPSIDFFRRSEFPWTIFVSVLKSSTDCNARYDRLWRHLSKLRERKTSSGLSDVISTHPDSNNNAEMIADSSINSLLHATVSNF